MLLYFRSALIRGEGLLRNSLSLILLSITFLGQAQTFPVRVTPVLTPPYSPFLTDYTDPGAERLTVQLLLNDLTVTEFRTKLRLTIEGVNITISTNPNYVPPPITLQGGVPQLIYGSDIADYFKLSNLVFQGLNPNEVEKNGGRLPEGIYRISIEVLDYNRNTVVSNKGSATAWMILNDPPFINLPVNNAKIKPLNPQNIVFQWTPRHRGSPNAAFTTEYEVKLVEIWPAGRNPYDAINTLRPIFEVTTESTMIVYGPAETPMVLGREYALQVRARDTGGRDVFKNNGYSEVVRFIYGDECPMPTAMDADDISTARARMKWQGNGQNSAYLLKLREQKEGARWFTERTEQSYYSATNLKAGTVYEYQLAGECDIYQSKESEIKTFSTLTENPNAFVCSDPNAVPPPDGSPPLPALFTNDFIHAGGFDVVVNQATGSNGRFTGEGLAIVPWFNSAKVRVTFRDISVNTSYQLTAGKIESVWDANSRFLVESEKTLAEGGGKGLESTLGTFEADTLVAIPGIILGVSVHPETGEITVDTRDGAVVIPREVGKTVAITDEAGNGYLVDKDGKVTKTTASDAQLAGARGEREYSTDPNLQIDFIKAGQTTFGLDGYQSVLSQNYQQTENGKYVSWKALASGQTDEVAATALGNGDITKASFRTGIDNQVLSPKPQGSNTQVLTITGKTHGMVDELLASYPNPDTTKGELVAGKLNLISYDIARKNLVLVSVNGTEAPGIGGLQQELNKIYGQGVVEWTSVQQQNIAVNGIDEAALDDGDSGLLSNYTDDMKKILRAYTSDNTLAENTYYLFLVKNSTDKNKLGYMPRKRQAGFIFVDAHSGQDLMLTIAHELGHGAFHLKHTFSEYSLARGVTENLMDYPAKTRLDKWQWDYIHNPEGVLGLFEDDEEGALVVVAKQKKGVPVITIGDNKVVDGKVFVHNGSDAKMKVKYEISDTTKTKIPYQLTLVPESTKTPIIYPATGYDTLIYNQEKEITLDSIPQGKYSLLYKLAKTEHKIIFFIREKKLEVTKEQLKIIFPNTDDKRVDEVVGFINTYSSDFDISTPERMAHFLGQIGAETGGLIKLKESPLYSPRTVVKIFPYPKYGHLLEKVVFDSTTYAYSYTSIDYDEDNCNDQEISRGNTIFPYQKANEVRNAYAAIKNDTLEVIVSGKLTKIEVYKARTDVTDANIDQLVKDPNYNNGLLRVKNKYIRSSALFDVTYACRMENGDVASKDGSTYLGKGFIHITGKGGYRALSAEWNKLYPSDPKEFHGKDIDLLENDVEIALKASMVFWKMKGLNAKADQGTSPTIVEEVGRVVNGGDNGMDHRKKYTQLAAENIK